MDPPWNKAYHFARKLLQRILGNRSSCGSGCVYCRATTEPCLLAHLFRGRWVDEPLGLSSFSCGCFLSQVVRDIIMPTTRKQPHTHTHNHTRACAPVLHPRPNRRFVTFETDLGGWNNVRMALETIFVENLRPNADIKFHATMICSVRSFLESSQSVSRRRKFSQKCNAFFLDTRV